MCNEWAEPVRVPYHPRVVPPSSARRPMPAVSLRLARTAFAGMAAWLALLFVRLAVAPGPSEEVAHLVLLAPLVLVPLFLDASVPASFGPAPLSLRVASWLLGPGALAAAASLVAPVGVWAGLLAGLWLVAAASVAVWALAGAVGPLRNGTLGSADAVLAVGWAMLPGGAVWLVLARAGVETGYGELVGLLTAAHFHYAGAFAAVWAGLLGRAVGPGRLHAALSAALVVGFWGVALGIAWGRGPVGGSGVETAGVVLLASAAAGLGAWGVVQAGRFESRLSGLMVAVSGGALVLAMGLALWFHVGGTLGLAAPDVGWMAARHGALNAYGFGLWGALGWRRLRPSGGGGT